MTYQIIKSGSDEKLNDGTVVYHDEYYVTDNPQQGPLDKEEKLFEGTYTRCLVYVGARAIGKSASLARRFAEGTYR